MFVQICVVYNTWKVCWSESERTRCSCLRWSIVLQEILREYLAFGSDLQALKNLMVLKPKTLETSCVMRSFSQCLLCNRIYYNRVSKVFLAKGVRRRVLFISAVQDQYVLCFGCKRMLSYGLWFLWWKRGLMVYRHKLLHCHIMVNALSKGETVLLKLSKVLWWVFGYRNQFGVAARRKGLCHKFWHTFWSKMPW